MHIAQVHKPRYTVHVAAVAGLRAQATDGIHHLPTLVRNILQNLCE